MIFYRKVSVYLLTKFKSAFDLINIDGEMCTVEICEIMFFEHLAVKNL